MTLSLPWHGHSTVQLDDGTHSLLIDPFFTDNPVATMAASDVSCTHIAITHGHGDHFGDCPQIAKACNATVIAAYEICEYLAEQGHTACEPGNPGGCITTDFGTVTFTHAFHSSSFEGRYMGMPCGLIITMGGSTIYHAGDTGLFGDMQLIGETWKPDLVLLPIGDRFTMGPDLATTAAEMIGAPAALPIHFNTWPLIEVDPDAFAPRNVEVLTMQPGETIDVAAVASTQ